MGMHNIYEKEMRVLSLIEELTTLKSEKGFKKIDTLKQYSALKESDIEKIIERKEKDLDELCIPIEQDFNSLTNYAKDSKKEYDSMKGDKTKTEFRDVVETTKQLYDSSKKILNLYYNYKGKQLVDTNLQVSPDMTTKKSVNNNLDYTHLASNNPCNFSELTCENVQGIRSNSDNSIDRIVSTYFTNWPNPNYSNKKEPQIMKSFEELYRNKSY